MQKFIVKHCCVNAEQWDGQSETFGSLSQGFGAVISLIENSRVVVMTPDGPMIAVIGDWIVKDASNTVFVMKANIFSNRYEPLVPH